MLLRRTCPYCGAVAFYPHELLDESRRCVQCQRVLDDMPAPAGRSFSGALDGDETAPAPVAVTEATENHEGDQSSKHRGLRTLHLAAVAIIAFLMLAAGAMYLWLNSAGSNTPAKRATREITQLDGAVQQFMTKYDVTYVPSQIKIARNYSSYDMQVPVDRESVDFLTKTIGRNSPNFTKKWQSQQGIHWTPAMQPGDSEILEGHQCLVFFLGGLCTQVNGQFNPVGFSVDASDPDVPPAKGSGIGPLYDFILNRLQVPPNKKFFPAYIDAYGTHSNGGVQYYAYFSSYKHDNGYNRYRSDGSLANPVSGPASAALVVSDCASLGVWPYASQLPATATGAPTYVRPKDFQIICAGEDGVFGPGTNLTLPVPYYWNSATAARIPAGGSDDRSNFATGKLQSWP